VRQSSSTKRQSSEAAVTHSAERMICQFAGFVPGSSTEFFTGLFNDPIHAQSRESVLSCRPAIAVLLLSFLAAPLPD
jgi:hypothetical protein